MSGHQIIRTVLKLIFKSGSFSWFSGLKTLHGGHEDASSMSGLSQWVKDPALQQAVALVADETQIQCCWLAVM